VSALAAIAREIIGLIVDDGSLAIGALAVVGLTAALRQAGLPPAWAALLLLAAIGLVLAENVRRAARSRSPE